MKDEFLATLSHEIRTPLNAVLGWTRILRTRDADAATCERALEVIERNAQAQLTLVERHARHGAHHHRQAAARRAGRRHAADRRWPPSTSMRPAADAKGIAIADLPLRRATAGRPAMPTVCSRSSGTCCRTRSSSRRRPGGIDRCSRSVEPARRADRHRHRPGHRAEFLPYVFDRFRQADASSARRHGGLGLGLALVRQLVELHGGRVQVDSAGLGLGTTFWVVLPARVEGMIAPNPIRSPIAGGVSGLSGIRVLIVEDEEDAREILIRSISDFGAEAIAVRSARRSAGVHARAAPEAKLPHVIISDIGMSGMDGFTLMRELAALPREHGGGRPGDRGSPRMRRPRIAAWRLRPASRRISRSRSRPSPWRPPSPASPPASAPPDGGGSRNSEFRIQTQAAAGSR